MGDFASNVLSQVTGALSGGSTAVAEPPASSPAPAATPTPSPTPASTPAATPTPASTPAAATPPNPDIPTPPEPEEFEFPPLDESGTPQPAADQTQPQDGQQQQPAAEDPNSWKLEDIEKMVPKQVIDKLLATPKGKGIYESYKLMRDLEKPIDQGGLGFRPNIEQLREMQQDSSDLQLMAHHFNNAHIDPTYAKDWASNWFVQDESGNIAPGAIASAAALIDLANQYGMAGNPTLYHVFARPIMAGAINELYQRGYAETADPKMRAVHFNVAHIFDEFINGEGNARAIPQGDWELPQPGAQTQPQQHPQQADVDAKLRRIADFEQGQAAAANNAIIARHQGELSRGLLKDVRFALKPIADLYPGKNGQLSLRYKAIERDVFNSVVQQVKNNPQALRDYTRALDYAKSTGSPEAITAATRVWLGVARPYTKALREQYLTDTQERLIPESQQRHAVLDEASQKRGVTSTGQPTAKDLGGGRPERLPGESSDDWVRRWTESVLGVAQG